MPDAREYNRQYHEAFYKTHSLFQQGSWLEKPDPELLGIVQKYFIGKKDIKVLDLGAGVGRHAIPIAEQIQEYGGKVVCVDPLELAVEQLRKYARQYGVEDAIEAHLAFAEDFDIKTEEYDFIVAQSSIEHSASKDAMLKTIRRMIDGTKSSGIHYVSLTTNLTEVVKDSDEVLPVNFEIHLAFNEAKPMLEDLYNGWDILTLDKHPYNEEQQKDNQTILWQADYLVLIAQK